MKNNTKKIFIRNDDVRNCVDIGLESLVNLSFKMKIPVSYAIEPGNISIDVIKFLKEIYNINSELVEIIQHGFNHNLDNRFKDKIEFGGDRDYLSQFNDLQKGVSIMERDFKDVWFRAISFPFGKYNKNTLKVVNQLKFLAISTSTNFNKQNLIKDFIGRKLKRHFLINKKVSYHTKKVPAFDFYDFGTSVNIIKRYISYDCAEHYNYEELLYSIIKSFKHTDTVGILLHHRFHKKEDFNNLEKIITYFQSQDNYQFTKISNLLPEN